jgi:hypothetical protein
MKDIGGRTLTRENIQRIQEAMSRIEDIDRSDAFKVYFNELQWRLDYLERFENDKSEV